MLDASHSASDNASHNASHDNAGATWQPSLLGVDEQPGCDPTFHGARRRFLGAGAWLDVVPGWVRGADLLFERIHTAADWATRERWMYDRMVVEPRLSTGSFADPPAPCGELAVALSAALRPRPLRHQRQPLPRRHRFGRVAWRHPRPLPAGDRRRHREPGRRSAPPPPAEGRRLVNPPHPEPRRPRRHGGHVPAHLGAQRPEDGERRLADQPDAPRTRRVLGRTPPPRGS